MGKKVMKEDEGYLGEDEGEGNGFAEDTDQQGDGARDEGMEVETEVQREMVFHGLPCALAMASRLIRNAQQRMVIKKPLRLHG